MTAQVTPFSGTKPALNQTQPDFDTNTQDWIDWQESSVIEFNAVAVEISAQNVAATASATAAAQSETNAALSATAAASSANFQGAWSGKTGAVSMPYTVSHNGVFWGLNTNTASIQTNEPGVSAIWTLLPNANLGESTIEVTPNALLGSGAFANIDQIARFVQNGLGRTTSTKTGNYIMVPTDTSIVFNGAGSITLTLLSPSLYNGKQIFLKNRAAQTVVSASSNVVPLGSGTAGTAILPAIADSWALLESDGTNWIILAAYDENMVNPTVAGLLSLNGGQAKFPATQNPSADANTLDDYEEGTWTPISSSGTGINSSAGRYTKIGRIVHLQGYISYSTTNPSTLGTTTITGVPFAFQEDTAFSGISNTSPPAKAGIGYCEGGTSTMYPPTWTTISFPDVWAFSLTYMTAN